MAFYKRTDPGNRNRWRQNVGHAMREVAERRRCPACGRGAALSAELSTNRYVTTRQCRYCKHVESHVLG